MSSNLISISEDRDIDTADGLMKINKIRHLPVVNANNELSGILSVKDIARAKDKKKPIKSVMTTPVRVVKKTANVKTVIELMLKLADPAVAGNPAYAMPTFRFDGGSTGSFGSDKARTSTSVVTASTDATVVVKTHTLVLSDPGSMTPPAETPGKPFGDGMLADILIRVTWQF